MNHFYTIFDYQKNEVQLAPKKYSYENNFIDFTVLPTTDENILLITIIFAVVFFCIIISICYYIRKRANNRNNLFNNMSINTFKSRSTDLGLEASVVYQRERAYSLNNSDDAESI